MRSQRVGHDCVTFSTLHDIILLLVVVLGILKTNEWVSCFKGVNIKASALHFRIQKSSSAAAAVSGAALESNSWLLIHSFNKNPWI